VAGSIPLDPEAGRDPQAADVLVRLDEVTKVYATSEVHVEALRGVSLVIRPGEFAAIMGASGSGKSTLMHIVGCIDRPTSGRYLLDGLDVSRLPRDRLAEIRNRTIGFVFQTFNLLARTSAIENVELPLSYAGVPPGERRRRAKEALERVGLADRLHHHPTQLSGGQQQRVAIARALVSRPKLVLADEPTGNLDSRASTDIMTLLHELWRSGITIVLVTHEDEVAAHASRVLVMKDGSISQDQLRQPSGRFRGIGP
jgi:putative ABC transport system ATP-binding protein